VAPRRSRYTIERAKEKWWSEFETIILGSTSGNGQQQIQQSTAFE
jgi:hypothetical protein